MIETEGNGHAPEEMLQDTIMEDTVKDMAALMEIGQDSITTQQKPGVLQRIITTPTKDEEYRQILYQADFVNEEQAVRASDAIAERQRYGVSITPIIDRVTAQCAVKSKRVNTAVSGINQHIFNSNSGGGAPNWKKKQETKSLG